MRITTIVLFSKETRLTRLSVLLDDDNLTTAWRHAYLVDVLWGQPIKLIQVFSTSEFHEYWWNGVVFIFFVPSTLCRASEASNIDCFKNWVWKLLTKNLNSLLKDKYFTFKHPKCLYLIFEVVNFWGFWGPATSGGDKKNKTKVIPSIFMKFRSRNNLDQLDRLTP